MDQIVTLARPSTLLNDDTIAEFFTFLDKLLIDMKTTWT